MSARKIRAAVFIVLAGLTASACAGRSKSGSIEHPTSAAELVLRIENGGGFLPVEATLMQSPSFSLFGDGRMIVQGPQIEIYPGPALPNLLVRDVTEEGVQAILEAARVAGLLGEDRHYDNQRIADASTTTFTVDADGARHVVSAYALFEGEEAVGSDDREAREALLGFQSKLSALESWLPQGSVGAEGAFDFDELRIYAHPGASPSDILPQKEMAWPLGVSLASFGEASLQTDLRCGSIFGDDLASLLSMAQSANQLTPWRSEGQLFSLTFRPLLPDESGCPT